MLAGIAAAAAVGLANAERVRAADRTGDIALLGELSREITATLSLDRVLADDQPAKPASASTTRKDTPATPAAPAVEAKPPAAPAPAKAPMWARADAQDEDLETKPADPGQQLGLFDQDKKA